MDHIFHSTMAIHSIAIPPILFKKWIQNSITLPRMRQNKLKFINHAKKSYRMMLNFLFPVKLVYGNFLLEFY